MKGKMVCLPRRPLLKTDDQLTAVVTHVDSVKQFVVQDCKSSNLIQRIHTWCQTSIKNTPIVTTPEELAVGSNCLVKSEIDGEWYRAKVLRLDKGWSTAKFVFLDTGDLAEYSYEDMRNKEVVAQLTPKLLGMCAQGLKCHWEAEKRKIGSAELQIFSEEKRKISLKILKSFDPEASEPSYYVSLPDFEMDQFVFKNIDVEKNRVNNEPVSEVRTKVAVITDNLKNEAAVAELQNISTQLKVEEDAGITDNLIKKAEIAEVGKISTQHGTEKEKLQTETPQLIEKFNELSMQPVVEKEMVLAEKSEWIEKFNKLETLNAQLEAENKKLKVEKSEWIEKFNELESKHKELEEYTREAEKMHKEKSKIPEQEVESLKVTLNGISVEMDKVKQKLEVANQENKILYTKCNGLSEKKDFVKKELVKLVSSLGQGDGFAKDE